MKELFNQALRATQSSFIPFFARRVLLQSLGHLLNVFQVHPFQVFLIHLMLCDILMVVSESDQLKLSIDCLIRTNTHTVVRGNH